MGCAENKLIFMRGGGQQSGHAVLLQRFSRSRKAGCGGSQATTCNGRYSSSTDSSASRSNICPLTVSAVVPDLVENLCNTAVGVAAI
jgi:hypothetical protein